MITIIGYENIKSPNSNIRNIWKGLHDKDIIERVIPKGSRYFNPEINKPVIFEPVYLYGLHIGISYIHSMITSKFPERLINEGLFDCHASRHIADSSDCILFTDSGLLRSLKIAKKKEITSIILHRKFHPKYIYKILKNKEYKIGIK